ncbi:hypothetical protein CPB85DRAFT_1311898 [Mucidula mucida]|nr:hypothetical protein CPB85DRAFT_1311898 [Mucidula mucida]
MSSAPPRRSGRLAAKDDKASSSAPKAVVKRKAKAAPAKKRARPASPEPERDDVNKETGSHSIRKPRKRVKTCAAAPENPTVAEASGSAQNEAGNVEELAQAPMDANTVAESSGSMRMRSTHESLDLDLAAELENINVETLRAFLMSKSNCFALWEGALQRMELPPVIGDLNEPQYTSLVFDNFCSHCGNEEKTHIMWEVRMRICEECLDKGIIMVTQQQLRHIQPFGDRYKAREIVNTVPRFELFRPVLYTMLFHHRNTWQRMVKESSNLRRGSPEYAAWYGQKLTDHYELELSCKKYEEWIEARDLARAAELRALLANRLTSIIARLQADGWQEELDDASVLTTLQSHPDVNVAKQLSDQSWEEIKPTLTELMFQLRVDLRRRKMQIKIKERTRLVEDLARAYFATLPDTPHNPPPSALATYQPFLDIIKNTPHNEDATTQLTQAFEAVPALCENWRASQAEELKAMLRKSRDAWHCQFYPTVLHYPHFASHMCFITSASVGETEVAVWTGRGIETLSDGMYKVCVEIVRASGLDPATATAQDMDAAEMRAPCFGSCPGELSLENDLAASSAPMLRYCLTFVCMHCGVADTSRTARAEHLRSAWDRGEVNTADHYRRSARYQHINEELIVVQKATPGGGIEAH